jgi:hypothetical protein
VEAPPYNLERAVQGVGEKWIFSSSISSFGYGHEAVRIRVNKKNYNIDSSMIKL